MLSELRGWRALGRRSSARAAANQNVDKVVVPHVAPAMPRKGLIGTNIH